MTTQQQTAAARKAQGEAELAAFLASVKHPTTVEAVQKVVAKQERLAEQDKVLAAKSQAPATKVAPALPPRKPAKRASKATALSKQGDTAKNVAKEIAASKVMAVTDPKVTKPVVVPTTRKAEASTAKAVAETKNALSANPPVKAAAKKPSMVLGTPASPTKVAKAVAEAKAAAVVPTKKPNTKVAILDLFYSNLELQLTTMETVLTLQHLHSGMNESSIRVWLTDLRKDGTLVKVGTRDGKDILTAGVPGTQWGLRGTTSTFALAHKDRKPPVFATPAPVAGGVSAGKKWNIPASLHTAIINAQRAFEKLETELTKFSA
jgi:hypothetical protein